MKAFVINSKTIFDPTHVLSAEYWGNIIEGKLPFQKGNGLGGRYTSISHTKELEKATYLTIDEARQLNIALTELVKAQKLVDKVKRKLNLQDKKSEKAERGMYFPKGVL